MKIFIYILFFIGFWLTLHTAFSAPKSFGQFYDEWNFARLQRKYSKAVAQPTPWVGFWWPYAANGIANTNFDDDEISPAEKLDMALGNKFGIVGWENRNHGFGRGAPSWWGHCNGWAVASIMEAEPRSPISVNGINFEVRDRKALLSEYWMESGSDFIGNRVWSSNDFSSAAFWDVVPAAFHLAMTNIVGRQGRSVIVDRYTGMEVWNHPVVAYEIDDIHPEDYLGADSRYDNIHKVNVRTTIWWSSDEVSADTITKPFEWKENISFVKRTLRYELWLDAPPVFDDQGRLISSGNIILTDRGVGGVWKNGVNREVLLNSHPDFIWIPLSYARSTGFKNPRINDAWIQNNISERQKMSTAN